MPEKTVIPAKAGMTSLNGMTGLTAMTSLTGMTTFKGDVPEGEDAPEIRRKLRSEEVLRTPCQRAVPHGGGGAATGAVRSNSTRNSRPSGRDSS